MALGGWGPYIARISVTVLAGVLVQGDVTSVWAESSLYTGAFCKWDGINHLWSLIVC